MARSMNQKLKVLYIIRLLAGTDASHVVTMAEILDELREHGISAERKSIYDDLDALRQFGVEIMNRRERPSGYYLRNKADLAALLCLPDIPAACADEKTGTEAAGAGAAPADGKPAVAETVSVPAWTDGKTKIELSCREEQSEQILRELGGKASVRGKGSGKKDGPLMIHMKFKAEPGEAFYGWLAGLGCQVKLQSPAPVIREYRKYLKEIRNLYKEE